MPLAIINRQQDQRCSSCCSKSLLWSSPLSAPVRGACLNADHQRRAGAAVHPRSAPDSAWYSRQGLPAWKPVVTPWSCQEWVDQIAPQEHSNDDRSDVWSCSLLTIKLFYPREELLRPPRPHTEAARMSTHSPTPTAKPVFRRRPRQCLRKHATVASCVKRICHQRREPGFPPVWLRFPCHITHASKVGYGKAQPRKYSRRAKVAFNQ